MSKISDTIESIELQSTSKSDTINSPNKTDFKLTSKEKREINKDEYFLQE